MTDTTTTVTTPAEAEVEAVKIHGWPVHPTANVFPMLSKADLKKLGEDIKANGLREPILFWTDELKDNPDLWLLDGRNRLAAMELVGLDVTETLKPKDATRVLTGDAHMLVVSYNIRRRHLTKKQQAELVVQATDANTEFLSRFEKKYTGKAGRPAGIRAEQLKLGALAGVSRADIDRARAKAAGTPVKQAARKTAAEKEGTVSTSTPDADLTVIDLLRKAKGEVHESYMLAKKLDWQSLQPGQQMDFMAAVRELGEELILVSEFAERPLTIEGLQNFVPTSVNSDPKPEPKKKAASPAKATAGAA